ncbi:MAG TPA: hypothetical protein VEY51_18535, partial [Chondromyces sp.]|nr:hypothetical protein [Chondromyces sp.]
MKLWHSVVGKVWGTILILVSFVLFFLTILLLEFFEGYHVNQVQDELSEKAEKIASIIDEHDNKQIGMEVAWELIDEPTHVIIAEDEKTFHYSPKDENDPKLTKEEILENDTLSKVFTEEKFVKEEMPVQGQLEQTNRY